MAAQGQENPATADFDSVLGPRTRQGDVFVRMTLAGLVARQNRKEVLPNDETSSGASVSLTRARRASR
jgi:hypothetical protein